MLKGSLNELQMYWITGKTLENIKEEQSFIEKCTVPLQ